jgi:NADP-dependent 3-hydroxy acid dehydrogenase YdfG
MSKRNVLITGATAGIGEATARLLAKNDFKLILCGRRQERLDALQSELAKFTEVTTLSFEIRNQNEVERAISSLPAAWKNVDVLINNAGNAHGFDPIQTGKLEDWDAMMDINVKGLLYVSREIIPG